MTSLLYPSKHSVPSQSCVWSQTGIITRPETVKFGQMCLGISDFELLTFTFCMGITFGNGSWFRFHGDTMTETSCRNGVTYARTYARGRWLRGMVAVDKQQWASILNCVCFDTCNQTVPSPLSKSIPYTVRHDSTSFWHIMKCYP